MQLQPIGDLDNSDNLEDLGLDLGLSFAPAAHACLYLICQSKSGQGYAAHEYVMMLLAQ
jgi:hypothetical protein